MFYKPRSIDFVLFCDSDEEIFSIYCVSMAKKKCIKLEAFEAFQRDRCKIDDIAYCMGQDIHHKYPLSCFPDVDIYDSIYFMNGYHGIFKGGGCESLSHYEWRLSLMILRENIFEIDHFGNEEIYPLEIALPVLPKPATYQMIYNNHIGLVVACNNEFEYDYMNEPQTKIASYYQLVYDNEFKWIEIPNDHQIPSYCTLAIINKSQLFV